MKAMAPASGSGNVVYFCVKPVAQCLRVGLGIVYNMKYLLVLILLLGTSAQGFADRVFQNNDQEQIAPISLKLDELIIYVETNGRRISAIDVSSGGILWTRDPYEDWGLRPYRFSKPVIVSLELAKKEGWLDVRFNSSQFGTIRVSTGTGYQGGND